ncbi:MAG: MBL fold metallo-hydrolase [Clostridia bacterium]|nr:MBL fold metallo-hydrolase [Clostridia bacterium]
MSNPIRIVTLYSGSGGNCTYLKLLDTTILIDAGKSARTLCNSLREIGSDIGEIDAIFVTHDHHDHVSALEVLAKKNEIPIHMTDRSAALFDRDPSAPIHSRLVRHDPVFTEEVGRFTVTSFCTPHDSRMSVGYRVSFVYEGKNYAVGIATDIGYVSDSVREGLRGCSAVVLESNHDEEMLMKGRYPYELKMRIRSRRGHLSNRDSAAFAADLAAEGTKAFLLAHLSEENNEPGLAWDEARSALSGLPVAVAVASPDLPTELLWEPEKEAVYDCR